MRSFLSLLLIFLLPGLPLRGAAKPNIVVIFMDDLGYADIGPFGATKQKTPNLDRMAKEGMKLTSFYAAPVCSVSRAQLLTGCYGARISVPGVYFPGQAEGLNPKEITIPERLKEQGYATACIGKWHLGDQAEFLPTNQGFDRYYGIPYSNDMQKKAIGGTEPVTPLLRDDKVETLLTDEQQSRIVELYTNEAIDFMKDNKDRPFFLYYAHTAVHTPIFPGEDFRGKSDNGRFGDWVEEVDFSVGQVLQTLRDLKLDENTLVIFTSDNGPWLTKGKDGGSALPLRGGKGSTWEGGVRVPTIARWPGKIAPGTVCDAVSGTIDLLPTFVSLSGGTIPNEPVIDGRDISALLLGKTTQSPREVHYYFSRYDLQAIRKGPWKLAIAAQPQSMGQNPLPDTQINPRLYHLDKEIGEQTNLAKEHPEVVAELLALAETIKSEIGGNTPTARRPAGLVDAPKTLYPTEERKEKSPKKPNAFPPVDLGKLKPGDTLSSGEAPQIEGRPFTISCLVETKKADGIILSHGGALMGYALHLQKGEVIFTVKQHEVETQVKAPWPDSGKPQAIIASLAKDGTLSLQIGDKPAQTKKGTGLLNGQPMEDFCIGCDTQNTVTTYADHSVFQGTISELKITSP